MAYDIPTRHLREIGRTKMCGRIIIVKKKHRIATRHPIEVRGDVIIMIIIIIIIKNGSKTISLQALFGRLSY
jgi:hypothetical protein